MKEKYITTQDFDGRFEAGEDVTHYLDIDKAKRPGLEKKKISISFPLWMLKKVDSEAKKMNVSRQSIIKVWIAEKLNETI